MTFCQPLPPYELNCLCDPDPYQLRWFAWTSTCIQDDNCQWAPILCSHINQQWIQGHIWRRHLIGMIGNRIHWSATRVVGKIGSQGDAAALMKSPRSYGTGNNILRFDKTVNKCDILSILILEITYNWSQITTSSWFNAHRRLRLLSL